MSDELIERLARAIHAAHMIEKGPLAAWTWEEASKPYYDRFAKAAIAAMDVAAEREAAARDALEAAAGWATKFAIFAEKMRADTHAACLTARSIADTIRAIDPAQFRGADNATSD